MRATSSTTPWTCSGVIVATEPTSSPVAGLNDSSVEAAGLRVSRGGHLADSKR